MSNQRQPKGEQDRTRSHVTLISAYKSGAIWPEQKQHMGKSRNLWVMAKFLLKWLTEQKVASKPFARLLLRRGGHRGCWVEAGNSQKAEAGSAVRNTLLVFTRSFLRVCRDDSTS